MRSLIFSTVFVVLAGPAMAQSQTPVAAPPGQSGPAVTGPEKDFLNYMATDNQAEIQSCLLAEKRAQNLAVKAFARLMVDDHVAIESQLAAVANAQGVQLANGLGSEGDATMAKMKTVSKAGFDSAFMQHQVEDHTDDVQKMQHELEVAKNPEVRALVYTALPVLQQHLQLAEAVQSSLQNGKMAANTAP